MNNYEKILPVEYNRMASITLIEYKKTLVELEVVKALLSHNTDEYERLVDDIVHHRDIRIDDRVFIIQEKLEG
jgi:hypothetical protein